MHHIIYILMMMVPTNVGMRWQLKAGDGAFTVSKIERTVNSISNADNERIE
jgi:hypothetical protein